MSEIVELTCINCPIGCQLTAALENGVVTSVKGNTCPRGDKYARQEVVNPVRTVTSSVKVNGGAKVRASVKTVPEIPKSKIFDVMEVIKKLEINAPVAIGDVLVEEIAGTSSRLVATSNVASL